jgi:hypothetical protein
MAAKTQTRAELDAQPHQPVVEFLPPGGPSAFTAEEWADYDNGRPDRCSPDLIRRAAVRQSRNRDGM